MLSLYDQMEMSFPEGWGDSPTPIRFWTLFHFVSDSSHVMALETHKSLNFSYSNVQNKIALDLIEREITGSSTRNGRHHPQRDSSQIRDDRNLTVLHSFLEIWFRVFHHVVEGLH